MKFVHLCKIYVRKQKKDAMDDNSIIRNLEALRKEKGWSQKEIARLIDVHPNTYIRMEAGKHTLICPHLYKIASVAGISTEELLLGYQPDEDVSKELGEAQARYAKELKTDRRMYEDQLRIRDEIIAQKEKEIENLSNLIEEKDKRLRDLDELKNIQKDYLTLLYANKGTTSELSESGND